MSAEPTLPSPSPLRRTRSQTRREEEAAAAARALTNGVDSDEPNGPTPGCAQCADEAAAAQAEGETNGTHAEVAATPIRRRTARAATTGAATLAPPPNDGLLSTGSTPPSSAPPSPSLRARQMASAALQSVQLSCQRYQLLAYEHIPEWLRDNRYIKKGYRANIGWRHSVESVCHLHNETVNVWSHLIAFLVMTCLLVLTMAILSPHGVDRLELDVVLSPRHAPVEGLEGCIPGGDGMCRNLHLPDNVTGSGEGADDPLAVLHTLLGENSDDTLLELLSRVQNHVPSLEALTKTMKERAQTVQQALQEALPSEAVQKLEAVGKGTRVSFASYVDRLEAKLQELKQSISNAVEATSPEASEKAQQATSRMKAEYEKLKTSLSELTRHFSSDLLHLRSLDLVRVSRAMLSEFHKSFERVAGTQRELPGVEVKVRAIVEGMDLGSGGVFGGAVRDAVEELSDPALQKELEAELAEGSRHPHVTTDAEGGKTAETSIGYMGIRASTSAARPGTVQLQLHSYLPRYPLGIFLVTAMLCLIFSSAYHLLHAVSFKWARRFQALDYAGIVLLTAGSTHPVIYYGFYCEPWIKWPYIALVWLLALFVFFIVILPAYRHQRYRVMKVVCFIVLGCSGLVPLAHFQHHLGSIHFIFYWLLVMGACYLTGAALYVTQVPERWWPGHFDLFCSSHQLWHVSIFAAVLVHYFGLMHLYEWRMTRVCLPGMVV